ncbi:MAG TPA: peptide chain release factor N(5)-glutamine methyltransferase, partial [Treponemataceae bacterium]|nr:peptide chain release factor N(5)-glutamine methyltransferase [Treponemataceae bacterium]
HVARSLLEDGRGEPLSALDGGSDGLDLVRALVPAALDVLAPNSRILIESGEYNASETARILKSSGFTDIVIHKDLENQDRVAEGKSHDGIP